MGRHALPGPVARPLRRTQIPRDRSGRQARADHARPVPLGSIGSLFRLDPGERQVLNEAYEAGLKHGVSVPLFGPCGRVAVVSFASSRDDVDEDQRLGRLNALAAQFHVAFSEIAHKVEVTRPAIELSPRERDCLNWVAEGKSSWDISVILAISESTVNFHIKNAMKKLRTTSRLVAVVKAIRLNLINPPSEHFP